jgi:3-oxoacyl-[acyl-carrier protein] reductase
VYDVMLDGKLVVVAGGTGNVGSYLVKGLLNAGARVAVPSRSQTKLRELSEHLQAHGVERMENLLPFIGDIGSEARAARLRGEIVNAAGSPDAVIASLGTWQPAGSIGAATTEQLHEVLANYLIAHFTTAKAFVPALEANGGTYAFINGPLAFELWPGSSLVSIATAAQHMLFRAFAQEHENDRIRIVELVNRAFIRGRQTQAESTVPGEAIADEAIAVITERR